MKDITIKIIKVRYDLYVMEVTRHTNRKVICTYCRDCLAVSTTNKEHLDYKQYPSTSSVRICSKCGAMTPSAIITAFSLSMGKLISMLERGDIYENSDLPEPIRFIAEPSTILSMKASMTNGKKRYK